MAAESRLEWVEPSGGVTGFPRIRADVPFEGPAFYRALAEDHGTMVGPGHWFGQPERAFRLGWGWPTPDELTHRAVRELYPQMYENFAAMQPA